MSTSGECKILVFEGARKYRITDDCVVTDDEPMEVSFVHAHALMGKPLDVVAEKKTNTTWLRVPNQSAWKTIHFRGEYYALWEGPRLVASALTDRDNQYVKESPEQEIVRIERMQNKEFSFPIDISKIEKIVVRGACDVVMRVSRTHDSLATQVSQGASFHSLVEKKQAAKAVSTVPDDFHNNISMIVKNAAGENVEVPYHEMNDLASQKKYFETFSDEQKAYWGKWVAVGRNKILAQGNDREEVSVMARGVYTKGHIYLARNVPRGEDVKALVDWFHAMLVMGKVFDGKWIVVEMINDSPHIIDSGDDKDALINKAKKMIGPGKKDALVLIRNVIGGNFIEI